ncbi:MAG: hypothetical protein ACLR7Z_12295 [Bilophila wadsworthia]
MIIANIGMLLIGYLLVRVCTRSSMCPAADHPGCHLHLVPGAYALRNSMFDVLLVLSGGIAYLLLRRRSCPQASPRLVLGRIIEENSS